MFARLRSFWRGVSKPSEMESELDDEMRFHVEARAEQLAQSGLARDEAIRRARIEFGGTENYREECRESHGMRWFNDLKQDLRYGARSIRKSPGLMLVAVVTLALSVGSTALLAGMVKQWVLQSVTYPNADRLTVAWKVDTKKGWTSGVSALDFQDWQAKNEVFESLSGWAAEEFNVTRANVDEMVTSDIPDLRRLLGSEGKHGEGLGLTNDWAYRIIKHVGNYGESFERNVGQGSVLKIARGLNGLWSKGGLQYAPPIR